MTSKKKFVVELEKEQIESIIFHIEHSDYFRPYNNDATESATDDEILVRQLSKIINRKTILS